MSRVIVRIPYALRPFTSGAAEITVEALTLRHALSVIDQNHPGLCARVLTPEGDIRPNVNLFVGDTSARNLDGLNTPLDDGAVVSIIPAVAGGAGGRASLDRQLELTHHGCRSALQGRTNQRQYQGEP